MTESRTRRASEATSAGATAECAEARAAAKRAGQDEVLQLLTWSAVARRRARDPGVVHGPCRVHPRHDQRFGARQKKPRQLPRLGAGWSASRFDSPHRYDTDRLKAHSLPGIWTGTGGPQLHMSRETVE